MSGLDAPALLGFAAGIIGTVAAFNRSSQVIPSTEFEKAYDEGEPALLRLRGWLSAMSADDPRAQVVKARLACLGAVLEELIAPGVAEPYFAGRSALRARLATLSPAGGYDFAGQLPPWLDATLAGSRRRWHTA